MKFPHLNSARADTSYPRLGTNILRDKSRPDRNRLHGTTSSGRFEPDAAGISISKDAEGVEVVVVLDLAAELDLFARLEEVLEPLGRLDEILPFHCNGRAVEKHHSLIEREPQIRPQIEFAIGAIHATELQARLGT